MIVSCRSCQTRFRIADGKVNERGVKVRCSRCGEVFVVRREDEPPAPKPEAELPWGAAPAAGFDQAPDETLIQDAPTRVATVPADLLAHKHEPDFSRTPPPDPFVGDDPFAGVDLHDGASSAVAVVPPPLPTSPRLPPGPPVPDEDVLAADDDSPPPIEDDPFAGLASVEAAPRPAPPASPAAADPFGLADMVGKPEGSGLDLDIPEVPPPAPPPPAPEHTDEERPKAVARLAIPDPPPPVSRPSRRQPGALSALASVAAGMLLLLAALTALVAARNGGFKAARFSLDSVFDALGVSRHPGPSLDLEPEDVVTAVYPTASGERILVVRGSIANHTREARGPAVRVSAEILGDGRRVMSRAEGFAGVAPSLEQVHDVRGQPDADDLFRTLGARAGPIDSGARAPFMVVFPDPPQRLDRVRVRVQAAVGPRPEAPPAPAPVPAAAVVDPPATPDVGRGPIPASAKRQQRPRPSTGAQVASDRPTP